jgi:flavin-binding protein dodecin
MKNQNNSSIAIGFFERSDIRIIIQVKEVILMSEDSIYKRIELIGSSPNSWEDAVKSVVEKASKTLRDLRIAEVDQLDVKLDNGKVVAFRARVKLSFKYEE